MEPTQQKPEYDQARAAGAALLRDIMPKADLPDVVMKLVVKAANAPVPRRRYTVGNSARIVEMSIQGTVCHTGVTHDARQTGRGIPSQRKRYAATFMIWRRDASFSLGLFK
jgi:hypothetical protein